MIDDDSERTETMDGYDEDYAGGAPGPNFDSRDAACRNYPEVDFFESAQKRWAMAICDSCPKHVQEPCLAYAVANVTVQGVWGGTSWNERLGMVRPAHLKLRPLRQKGCTVFRLSTPDHKAPRYRASYKGMTTLQGEPLEAIKPTPIAALAALMVKAEGLPTAQRDIRDKMREMRDVAPTSVPLASRAKAAARDSERTESSEAAAELASGA